MNPITIQCVRCSACLLLGVDIQERVRGRSGRLPCSGCSEKIRIDGRGERLEFTGARVVELATLELDEAPSARGEQLSLLPSPPARAEVRTRPPLPRSRSLQPRPLAVHPPRPSGAPRPMLASNPFDELGSLIPVVPLQGVRLTADGRLVNRADEAPKAKRSRMRTWAPLAAAGLLATGFASARVSSMLPLGRSQAPQVAEVASSVLEQNSPAEGVAEAVEPRLLADEAPTAREHAAQTATDAATAQREMASAQVRSRAPADRRDGADEAPLATAEATASEAADATPSAAGMPSDVATEASEAAADADDGSGGDDTIAGPEFSPEAALVALQQVAAEAVSCKQPGEPAGNARVLVTFAPSGRVTTANVSGVYAATPTGGCIAGRFRTATVPAFVGAHVTVSKTISLQ